VAKVSTTPPRPPERGSRSTCLAEADGFGASFLRPATRLRSR